jgi:lipopolysaccharide assembly outer membrane protein LptD (OstA)
MVLGIWLLCAGTSTPTAAQDAPAPSDTSGVRRVSCLNFDYFQQQVERGERVRRAWGNVYCEQEETLLWADRVNLYAARDEVTFLGNVRVVERGDSLFTPNLVYDQREKVGHATGGVRLSDGEVEVTAPSGRYFNREKRAEFEEGVQMVDSASVLTSQAGEYWSDEKRAEFYTDVRLLQDRARLEADSVTYFRETELSIARGHVFIARLGGGDAAPDSSNRTYLFGDWARNDEAAGTSEITGRPLLIQLQADSAGALPDTLFIRARRLVVERRDSLQRLVAVDSVKIWQDDFTSIADSVVYDRIEQEGQPVREEIRLYRGPIVWFEQTQVTGDTVLVTILDGSVDSLRVRSRAFLAEQDTTLERINQLRGGNLVGLFKNDSLRAVQVGPNAESIRFRKQGTTPDGAVQISADAIEIALKDGEVRRIRYTEGIQAKAYSEEILPAPLQLDGFRWDPQLRPPRAEVLKEPRVVAWLQRHPGSS